MTEERSNEEPRPYGDIVLDLAAVDNTSGGMCYSTGGTRRETFRLAKDVGPRYEEEAERQFSEAEWGELTARAEAAEAHIAAVAELCEGSDGIGFAWVHEIRRAAGLIDLAAPVSPQPEPLTLSCAPASCFCSCHRPGGMAVSHVAPCCYPDAQPEPPTERWAVDLIDCGRDDGVQVCATWAEADAFRQSYVASAEGMEHCERVAILHRAVPGTRLGYHDPAPYFGPGPLSEEGR